MPKLPSSLTVLSSLLLFGACGADSHRSLSKWTGTLEGSERCGTVEYALEMRLFQDQVEGQQHDRILMKFRLHPAGDIGRYPNSSVVLRFLDADAFELDTVTFNIIEGRIGSVPELGQPWMIEFDSETHRLTMAEYDEIKSIKAGFHWNTTGYPNDKDVSPLSFDLDDLESVSQVFDRARRYLERARPASLVVGQETVLPFESVVPFAMALHNELLKHDAFQGQVPTLEEAVQHLTSIIREALKVSIIGSK